MAYARGVVTSDDCATVRREERPPLCGTPECQCDRMTLGGFERWDVARKWRTLLDRGWISLRDMTGEDFADVEALEVAMVDARGDLAHTLRAEARAKGLKPAQVDEYVARGMAELGG